MAANSASGLLSLDVGTLFVIAICVATLLGFLLLSAWMQERVGALAWWGAAYLIGGASGGLWHFGHLIAPALLANIGTGLLFVAVGMIWTGARVFHGRPVRWIAMLCGGAFWLIASFTPAFALSAASRIFVSALIVAAYTCLTAAQLRRERRKALIRRWPAAFVPMLHGTIFLLPAALAILSSHGDGMHNAAGSWIAAFAVEVVLYVVGTAFIVLILAKDHTLRLYKMAATTDPLSGLLNRRGFFEAAGILMARNRKRATAVSVLAFDLDRFKSINDRHGHAAGDAVLQLFASVVRETMRGSDVIGRLGGEEFVALLRSTLPDAVTVAERVRSAFAAASILHNGKSIAATVSVGVASGSASAAIDQLVARADAALYRAKALGRDRVETARETIPAAPQPAHGGRSTVRSVEKPTETAAAEAAPAVRIAYAMSG